MQENDKVCGWTIMTKLETERLEVFGFTERYSPLSYEDTPTREVSAYMETTGIRKRKIAEYPFVVSFGDKPTPNCNQDMAVCLDMSKKGTIGRFIFMTKDNFESLMRGGPYLPFRLQNAEGITSNMIGLTFEIAEDEVVHE